MTPKRTRVAKRAKAFRFEFNDVGGDAVKVFTYNGDGDPLIYVSCHDEDGENTGMAFSKPMARRLAKALLRFCEGT